MKKLFFLPLFALILTGCGSEYDEVIDDAIAFNQEEGISVDEEIETRENAEIMVWEDGRYISAVFFDNEGNEEGDFIIENVRGNFSIKSGDLDRERENADPDYMERFGEEID